MSAVPRHAPRHVASQSFIDMPEPEWGKLLSITALVIPMSMLPFAHAFDLPVMVVLCSNLGECVLMLAAFLTLPPDLEAGLASPFTLRFFTFGTVWIQGIVTAIKLRRADLREPEEAAGAAFSTLLLIALVYWSTSALWRRIYSPWHALRGAFTMDAGLGIACNCALYAHTSGAARSYVQGNCSFAEGLVGDLKLFALVAISAPSTRRAIHRRLWGAGGGGGGGSGAGAGVGSRYASWRRVCVLGRGRFGVAVLLRDDVGGAADVCSKEVNTEGMNIKEMAAIENEVLVLRSIRHEHVVRYLDAFHQGALLHIVLEYAEGGSLRAAIDAAVDAGGRPFSSAQLSRWLLQLARGLDFIHGLDILHRDLSTKNVLLTAPPSDASAAVRIADFGLAATVSASSGLASTMVGTPNSCSPELYRGERYGRPADLWGVGVILFELLTLSTPFTAQNVAALCQQIITAAYDDDALARCPHPDALTHLASRDALFHTDPAARLTLAELVDRLGHVADIDGSGPAG